ncbi:MAG: hypothetical protein IPM06_19500 [Rhizobiales bacterium]|nr:hypothetical protein [Hyphomicrobiales bacterium]
MSDEIEVGIVARDKTAAGTASAVSNIRKVDQAVTTSSRAMAGLSASGKAMGFVLGGFAATGAFQLAQGIASGTATLAQMNVQVTRSRAAFTILSGGADQARAKLEAVKRASMGTVSELDAMQLANKAAALGMAKTASELENVVGTATKISMVMGGDVGDVLDNLSAAAANLSFVRLDTMGISAGKTKDKMKELLETTTGLTQEQAFLNAAIAVSKETFAGIGEGADVAIDGTKRLQSAWADLVNSISEGAVGDAANRALNGAADAVRGFSDRIAADELASKQALLEIFDENIAARQKEIESAGEAAQATMAYLTVAGASAEAFENAAIATWKSTEAKRAAQAAAIADRDALQAEIVAITGATNATIVAGGVAGYTAGSWFTLAEGLYATAGAAGAVSRAYAGIGPGPDTRGRGEKADAVVGGGKQREILSNSMKIGLAEPDQGARYSLNLVARSAKDAASGMGGVAEAASDLSGTLEGAIRKIPGLLSTSSVTDLDMKKAAAGMSVRYPDSYVREAKDELINGKDYANIDPAELAKSLGLDISVGAELIVAELERQWASGEYFVDPANLLKIDWEAYRVLMQQEANASLGAQNLIAEAMKQGITPESWEAATTGTGPLIVAGVEASLDASDMTPAATKFGDKLDRAFRDTGSDANAAARGAGESLAQAINAGFADAAGRLSWGVPASVGAPADATTPPPARAVGTSYWPGGVVRVHKDETIILPRGSGIRTATESGATNERGGQVVINAVVQSPITLEMLTDQVRRRLQRFS